MKRGLSVLVSLIAAMTLALCALAAEYTDGTYNYTYSVGSDKITAVSGSEETGDYICYDYHLSAPLVSAQQSFSDGKGIYGSILFEVPDGTVISANSADVYGLAFDGESRSGGSAPECSGFSCTVRKENGIVLIRPGADWALPILLVRAV